MFNNLILLWPLLIIITNLVITYNFKTTKKNNYIFMLVLDIIVITIIFLVNSLELFSLVYLINNIIILLYYKKNIKIQISNLKIRYLLMIFLFFNIAIFLELTVFNIRSYMSLNYKPITLLDKVELNTNMKKITNNKYKVVTENPYIEIKNINNKVHNVYIDINSTKTDSYDIIPFFTDEANKLYIQLNSRTVSKKIYKSKILNFNTSGKSEKLKFEFDFLNGDEILINNLVINSKIDLRINFIRVFLVFLILLFIYFLRPNSKLYTIKYNEFKKRRFLLVMFILLIISSYSVLSIRAIRDFNSNTSNIHNRVADSLIEGKTYFIDKNGSEELLNTMANPYDHNLREKIFKEHNMTYLWDSAFYKGRYYSYFGVVPIILFYVPFKLITNHNLQTSFIVFCITMLSAIFLILLFNQIIKNFFKKCSVGLFILINLILIYCSGLMYCLKLPDLYNLPIITGIMFTYLGLIFLVSCINKLSKFKLFCGSLCLALVAGCRPQLLLGSILIIPLIYLYIKNNKLTKKELILNALMIVIPYILVAGALMYYNYIRFGSPFDFGANYNLTTNDMTKRGFVFGRIPLGIIIFLFNPINMKNIFPYIIETSLETNYLGITIYEPIYGGLFFSTSITILNLFIFKLKKYINNKFIFNLCLLLIGASLIIIIADTEMAGILARYFTDFQWLLVISSVLIILALNESGKFNKKLLLKIIFLLATLSLIYQGFYFFVSISNDFKFNNLRFWLEFYYLIQFWL